MGRDSEVAAFDVRRRTTLWTSRCGRGIPFGTNVGVASGIAVFSNGDLCAFDLQTGAPRWNSGGRYFAGPGRIAIAGDLVLAMNGRRDTLLGIELATGAVRFASPVMPDSGVMSSLGLTEWRGTVYVGFLGRDPRVPPRSGLVAIDARTGVVRWTREFDDLRAGQGDLRCDGGAVVADGRVFVGAGDGSVVAIAEADGHVLWRSSPGDWYLEWSSTRHFAIEAGALYATNTAVVTGRIDVFDPATGQIIRAIVDREVEAALDDDLVIVGDLLLNTGNGPLNVFDKRSGAFLQRIGPSDGRAADGVWASPVVVDDLVVVPHETKGIGLYAVSRR